jgi:hypothetical protein
MHRTIIPCQTGHNSAQPNHHRHTGATPSSFIIERCEYLVCRRAWCKNPEWDDNDEEAVYVDYEQDAFDEGQVFGEEDVEEDAEDHDSPDEEGALVRLGCVGAGV